MYNTIDIHEIVYWLIIIIFILMVVINTLVATGTNFIAIWDVISIANIMSTEFDVNWSLNLVEYL